VVAAVAVFLVLSTGARAAGLLIADGGFGGNLRIVSHEVEVTINNGVAITQVTQVFRNEENRQVEALYTFPVPKSASVANFSMWINGKEMIGEVLEKQRARQIYNSYKQQRRDPGLLEQTDFKTFEMRIFPIGPKAEQRVQVTYYQELEWDGDWVTYVYPLATTTRQSIDERTEGTFSLDVNCKSEIPIVDRQSPSHGDAFAFVSHTPNYLQAGLETREGSLARDVVLAYQTKRARTGLDLIANKTGKEDGYFCLMLTVGQELDALADQGMDYVFVLDVSGSMQNDGKMNLSRSSVAEFVNVLGDKDRFELVAFNMSPTGLFGQLATPNAENKQRATGFLNAQRPRGKTVLKTAIAQAYQHADSDRTLNVIILSDGLTEQSERAQLLQLIRQRPSSARVFCIGVGNDVNRNLLRTIAEDAGGLAAFVSRGDDFGRQARAFRRKLLRPVATDVTMELKGADIYDVEPKKLPNLFHGSPIRMYGRYRAGGPVSVQLGASISGRPFAKTIDIQLPDTSDDNPEIERMWAWHKIQRLLREADRQGDRSPAVPEIVRLGEAYSIASEYTSFIVLENDAEYKRWQIKRRNALRIERDRNAQQRVRQALESLRDKAASQIGPADEKAPAQAKAATPTPSTKPAAPSGPTVSQNPPRRRSRGWDIDLPGGGGGGALDPLSMIGVLLMGAGAFWPRRRRD
jgi:Ca-activated chloride channel family protein